MKRTAWWQAFAIIAIVMISLGALAAFVLLRPRPIVSSHLLAETDFGGPDPHLHVAVISAEPVPSSLARELALSGSGYLVVLRARNSAAGDFVVDPRNLRIVVRDSEETEYPPVSPPAGVTLVRVSEGFTRALSPGEQEQNTLLFDLPPGVSQPMLWVMPRSRVVDWFPALEKSLIFPKLVFDLPASR